MEKNKISKEEFYKIRAERYPMEDPEAIIRYRRAMTWLDIKNDIAVREVGCKFAVLRDLLNNTTKNSDYVAVDIDEATLCKIECYDPEKFISHNVNNGMPFSNESADYIFCLEVLEHLENPTAFFLEAKRVLKPGGKLIISVPNPYCWMEMVGNIRGLSDNEGHISSFTHQNVDALLHFSGLKLLDKMGTFTRLPFTRRIFGEYILVETDNIFLSRSYMFLIQK